MFYTTNNNSGSLEPEWPGMFSVWDPSENAAKAWFQNPQNHDFSSWSTLKASDGPPWKSIDGAVVKMFGLESHDLNTARDQACSALWPNDNFPSKKPITPKDRQRAGELLAQKLLAITTKVWKDFPLAIIWLTDACQIIAPKQVSKWKGNKSRSNPGKMSNKKRKKSNAQSLAREQYQKLTDADFHSKFINYICENLKN